MTKKNSLGRAVLLMLGSYAFGFNLHNIIHEFGHAVAIWLQGGRMTGFYFHPYDACLNFSTAVPNHILLYAGGAYIGGLSTIIFAVLAWRFRTPFILPFVAACAAGLTTTARWMLITPFSDVFTDYSSMVALGVPVTFIILSGVIFLIIGVVVRILYLPLVGVLYDTSIGHRLLIYLLGILPYYIGGCAYHNITKGSSFLAMAPSLGIVAVFLSIETICSKLIPQWIPFFKTIKPARVRTAHIVAAWFGFIILLAVMVFVSTTPE
jgi:hypothetical protein